MGVLSFLFRIAVVFVSVGLLSSPSIEAQILFIQVPDPHANYENIPYFLKTVVARAEAFRAKYPEGDVILYVNGDLAGSGIYSEADGGWLDYQLFLELAKSMHIGVGLGNHEGLDLHGIQPADLKVPQGVESNELFFNQTKTFVESMRGITGNPNFKILAANLKKTPQGADLFGDFQDIQLRSGKVLRIVGMTLEDYFQQSGYKRSDKFFPFEMSTPMSFLETMIDQYRQASLGGADFVVFEVHDGVENIARAFNGFLREGSRAHLARDPRILFVGAGHLHNFKSEAVNGILVDESGSDYAFSELLFDDNGNLIDQKLWKPESQKAFADFEGLSDGQKEMISLSERRVADFRNQNSQVLRERLIFPADIDGKNKNARRHFVGLHFAKAMRNWGQTQLEPLIQSGKVERPAETVGLMNSLSFGWSALWPPLFEGDITEATVKSVVRYLSRWSLIYVKGEDLRKLVNAMKAYGASQAYPFLTPILFGVEERNSHLLISATRRLIKDHDVYAVALDHWTRSNGYRIPKLDSVFSRIIWELPDPESNYSAAVRHFPKTSTDCAQLMSSFPEFKK